MVIVIGIVTSFVLLLAVFLFFGFLFNALEELYAAIFKRPFYVHYYPVKKLLTPEQEYILRHEFPFYHALPDKKKAYFRHRVAKFIETYPFIGKQGFIITDQARILVAATSTMLTFGMRTYLFEVIDKIIIYPGQYLSSITHEYHKGEFNPRVKAIVFSWEDFMIGYEAGNDNLNLGIHEFAHVLHYHGSKYEDASAIIFKRMYRRISLEITHVNNRKKLLDSNYFRKYAYTNQHEFLAVIIEHYFETPQLFRQKFPELYKKVSLMLNHRHA